MVVEELIGIKEERRRIGDEPHRRREGLEVRDVLRVSASAMAPCGKGT